MADVAVQASGEDRTDHRLCVCVRAGRSACQPPEDRCATRRTSPPGPPALPRKSQRGGAPARVGWDAARDVRQAPPALSPSHPPSRGRAGHAHQLGRNLERALLRLRHHARQGKGRGRMGGIGGRRERAGGASRREAGTAPGQARHSGDAGALGRPAQGRARRGVLRTRSGCPGRPHSTLAALRRCRRSFAAWWSRRRSSRCESGWLGGWAAGRRRRQRLQAGHCPAHWWVLWPVPTSGSVLLPAAARSHTRPPCIPLFPSLRRP